MITRFGISFHFVFARGISALSQILSSLFILKTFGVAQYGLVATLVAVQAISAIADLGVSNKAIAKISDLKETGKQESEGLDALRAVLVSSVLFSLFSISGILLFLRLEWFSFLEISWFYFLVAAATFPPVSVGLATVKFDLAMGRETRSAYTPSLIMTATALAQFSCVLLESSDALLLSTVAVPAFLYLGKGLRWSTNARKSRQPFISPDQNSGVWNRVKDSRGYLALGIVGFMSYGGDALIVSTVSTLEQTGIFSVYSKYVVFIGATLSTAAAPLWTYFAGNKSRLEAIQRLRLSTRFSATLAFVISSGVAAATTVFVLEERNFERSPAWFIIVSAILWSTILAGIAPSMMYMNGRDLENQQAYFTSLAMALNVVLSLALTAGLGASGPFWGSVLAYVLVVIPCVRHYVKKDLRFRYES